MAANVTRPRSAEKPAWPIRWIPGDDPNAVPADGAALCLSGGGYRAMLFHLGALWRLNELGYLDRSRLKRVSSVSGGSLTAGILAMNWTKLGLDAGSIAAPEAFDSFVVTPIRDQARRTVDLAAAFAGLADIGSHGSHLTNFYRHMFGDAKLADLSDSGPTFIFNATSLQTGELVILALFDVIENALRTKTKRGCAFINASLEINRPGHPVREAALAHLRAREGLVRQLLTEAGVEDADLAAQVTLLVDGAYAVGGSRRDPAAARHAKAAVAALLASRVVDDQ